MRLQHVLTEDQKLVKRLLKGEEAAFNQFFNEYFGRLYRFALTRLDDEEAARDVVQETMGRAVRKIGTYRGEAALFTWLCQICRSQLSDYFSRRARENSRVVPFEDDPHIRAAIEAFESTDGGPELELRRSELSQLVKGVLDRLPARYGNALEWKYIDGLSVDAIAERLGVQHAAAQSILQRARQAFRDGFESVYGAWAVSREHGSI